MHRPGRYASLREGLVGAWCPSVSGSFGYSLPDLSGYGNNGTLTNMDPPNDWVTSGGKAALDFDGSNDYVDLGNKPQFDFGSDNCSISLWINVRSIAASGSRNYVLTKGNQSSTTFNGLVLTTFIYSGSNFIQCNFGTGTSQNDVSISPVSLNTWFHCVFEINGTNRYGYRNGVNVSSSSHISATINSTAYSLLFGTQSAGGSGGTYFDGLLSDVRFYKRAITQSEIQLLYTGGPGVGLIPERRRWFYYTAPSLFTASASLTTGATTCSGSATHTPPTYTGTSAVTTAATTCSGSATFTAPTYTAAASVTIAAATCSASGTFVTPVNTGTSVITVGAATASGAATFAVPVYTASAAVAVGATIVNVAGSVVVPTFTGAAAVSVGAAVASGVAIFDSNTPPTIPGAEFTAPDGRLRYTAPDDRLHYTAIEA